MQRSDSPARNIPGLFLGDPSSGFRIPFDADFAAYRVFGLFLVPIFALLWLVSPAAVTMAVFAQRAGRLVGPHLPKAWGPRRGPRVLRRNLTPALFAAMVLVYALLLVPSVRFWANPLAWWQALALAPVAAVLLTRWVMPRIGPNTPLSYWMALLPRVARGPRAQRATATYVPSVIESHDDALHELELLALTIDPREVTMRTALPKVQPIEFACWQPEDADEAAKVIAWVGSHGRPAVVLDGDVLRVDVTEDESRRVKPGHYLVHDPSAFDRRRQWRLFDPQAFAASFEVQS